MDKNIVFLSWSHWPNANGGQGISDLIFRSSGLRFGVKSCCIIEWRLDLVPHVVKLRQLIWYDQSMARSVGSIIILGYYKCIERIVMDGSGTHTTWSLAVRGDTLHHSALKITEINYHENIQQEHLPEPYSFILKLKPFHSRKLLTFPPIFTIFFISERTAH